MRSSKDPASIQHYSNVASVGSTAPILTPRVFLTLVYFDYVPNPHGIRLHKRDSILLNEYIIPPSSFTPIKHLFESSPPIGTGSEHSCVRV